MDRYFLMEAISCGDMDGVVKFLESGGNVNVYFSGLSPLIHAILSGTSSYFSAFEESAQRHLQILSKNKFISDDIILLLIRSGAEVNIKYPCNLMTPLHLALKYRRSDKVIHALIDAGSDINAECANSKTTLMYAVEYYCDAFIISKLLRKGANVNHQCRLGRTPLIYALINGVNPEILNILINSGADVNLASSAGISPILYALRNDVDKIIIKMLIEAGADVNHVCLAGWTALIYAAIFSTDSEVINILVNAGSNINSVCDKGKTALFCAIENSNKSIIEELIRNGADVNHCCTAGRTPLFYAVAKSDSELATVLINAGANVHKCDNLGRNVLSCLSPCDNCSEDNCKNKFITNLLLRYGVDLTVVDGMQNTLIHLVNCKYFIALAVSRSVYIEAKNCNKSTALINAVVENNTVKVNYLLQLNANPDCITNSASELLDCTDYRFTVLFLTSDEILNLLFYHGANLPAINNCYIKPLDHSAPCFLAVIKHHLLYTYEDELNYNFCDVNNKKMLIKINLSINECKIELHKMQQLFIKEGLTFYEFCILKKLYHSKFIGIPVNDYNYSLKKIKGLFPVYQDLIIMRIKDNHFKRCRNLLINSLEKLVMKPFSNSDVFFNFDCLYRIAFYLDNKQLYKFFLCSVLN